MCALGQHFKEAGSQSLPHRHCGFYDVTEVDPSTDQFNRPGCSVGLFSGEVRTRRAEGLPPSRLPSALRGVDEEWRVAEGKWVPGHTAYLRGDEGESRPSNSQLVATMPQVL